MQLADVGTVKKAWSFGSKDRQCHIVVFDWLEDCLLGPKGQKRRRVEKGYTLDRTIKRLEKGKTDHADFRNKFEDGLVSVCCWLYSHDCVPVFEAVY